TLGDDIVTAVEVTPLATDPTSRGFQTQFADGIAAAIVGQDIDTLAVSRIGGSSLASGGVNEALATIKAEATSCTSTRFPSPRTARRSGRTGASTPPSPSPRPSGQPCSPGWNASTGTGRGSEPTPASRASRRAPDGTPSPTTPGLSWRSTAS